MKIMLKISPAPRSLSMDMKALPSSLLNVQIIFILWVILLKASLVKWWTRLRTCLEFTDCFSKFGLTKQNCSNSFSRLHKHASLWIIKNSTGDFIDSKFSFCNCHKSEAFLYWSEMYIILHFYRSANHCFTAMLLSKESTWIMIHIICEETTDVDCKQTFLNFGSIIHDGAFSGEFGILTHEQSHLDHMCRHSCRFGTLYGCLFGGTK